MRVLISDDDKFNRALLKRLLEKHEIECLQVNNGAEALELLKRDKSIDIVVSDILMPVMDGFQFTMKVKKDKNLSSVPIILYSSTYREDEDAALAYKVGADLFLLKPAPPEKLMNEIYNLTAGGKKESKSPVKRKPADYKEDEYKLYNERLIKKLEHKLFELQQSNESARKAEIKSGRHQIKYLTVFENVNDGILLVRDKLIIDCNLKAAELFGKDENEILNKTLWELSPEYQLSGNSSLALLKEKFKEVLEQKRVIFEWSILNADNDLIDVEISLSAFYLDDKTQFLFVLRDLSERKKADLNLRKAYREIKNLKEKLENENVYLKSEIKQSHNFEEIITQNKNFLNFLNIVGDVSKSDTTVLITGETGTGKELIARAIHQLSSRNKKSLIKFNCAAIPPTLIESELFGHEKGSFTGAYQKQIGRFEMADGGTIFLDEIGDLPVDLQTKLLRVLQEGEFERIGGNTTIKADVRIIAATNRDLEEMIENGSFRLDLFYRLNVFPLRVPPLRERKDDIPILVQHFIDKYSKRLGKKIDIISNTSLKMLMDYDWPGNIRELENIIERAVVVTSGDKLIVGDWLKHSTKIIRDTFPKLDDMEREYIQDVLKYCRGKVSGKGGAAEILGMKPTTLKSRLIKLGIK